MTNRMNNLINKLPEEDQQRTTGRVIYGSIYEDIGKATELLLPVFSEQQRFISSCIKSRTRIDFKCEVHQFTLRELTDNHSRS